MNKLETRLSQIAKNKNIDSGELMQQKTEIDKKITSFVSRWGEWLMGELKNALSDQLSQEVIRFLSKTVRANMIEGSSHDSDSSITSGGAGGADDGLRVNAIERPSHDSSSSTLGVLRGGGAGESDIDGIEEDGAIDWSEDGKRERLKKDMEKRNRLEFLCDELSTIFQSIQAALCAATSVGANNLVNETAQGVLKENLKECIGSRMDEMSTLAESEIKKVSNELSTNLNKCIYSLQSSFAIADSNELETFIRSVTDDVKSRYKDCVEKRAHSNDLNEHLREIVEEVNRLAEDDSTHSDVIMMKLNYWVAQVSDRVKQWVAEIRLVSEATLNKFEEEVLKKYESECKSQNLPDFNAQPRIQKLEYHINLFKCEQSKIVNKHIEKAHSACLKTKQIIASKANLIIQRQKNGSTNEQRMEGLVKTLKRVEELVKRVGGSDATTSQRSDELKQMKETLEEIKRNLSAIDNRPPVCDHMIQKSTPDHLEQTRESTTASDQRLERIEALLVSGILAPPLSNNVETGPKTSEDTGSDMETNSITSCESRISESDSDKEISGVRMIKLQYGNEEGDFISVKTDVTKPSDGSEWQGKVPPEFETNNNESASDISNGGPGGGSRDEVGLSETQRKSINEQWNYNEKGENIHFVHPEHLECNNCAREWHRSSNGEDLLHFQRLLRATVRDTTPLIPVDDGTPNHVQRRLPRRLNALLYNAIGVDAKVARYIATVLSEFERVASSALNDRELKNDSSARGLWLEMTVSTALTAAIRMWTTAVDIAAINRINDTAPPHIILDSDRAVERHRSLESVASRLLIARKFSDDAPRLQALIVLISFIVEHLALYETRAKWCVDVMETAQLKGVRVRLKESKDLKSRTTKFEVVYDFENTRNVIKEHSKNLRRLKDRVLDFLHSSALTLLTFTVDPQIPVADKEQKCYLQLKGDEVIMSSSNEKTSVLIRDTGSGSVALNVRRLVLSAFCSSVPVELQRCFSYDKLKSYRPPTSHLLFSTVHLLPSGRGTPVEGWMDGNVYQEDEDKLIKLVKSILIPPDRVPISRSSPSSYVRTRTWDTAVTDSKGSEEDGNIGDNEPIETKQLGSGVFVVAPKSIVPSIAKKLVGSRPEGVVVIGSNKTGRVLLYPTKIAASAKTWSIPSVRLLREIVTSLEISSCERAAVSNGRHELAASILCRALRKTAAAHSLNVVTNTSARPKTQLPISQSSTMRELVVPDRAAVKNISGEWPYFQSSDSGVAIVTRNDNNDHFLADLEREAGAVMQPFLRWTLGAIPSNIKGLLISAMISSDSYTFNSMRVYTPTFLTALASLHWCTEGRKRALIS